MHYHIALVMDKMYKVDMPDKSGMWEYGMSHVRRIRNVGYMLKYVGKTEQKDLYSYPKGARLYATSVNNIGGGAKEAYRHISGIIKIVDAVDMDKWEYKGSSLTEGYGKNVIAGGKIV